MPFFILDHERRAQSLYQPCQPYQLNWMTYNT
jgi:hypothetical protein